jgi:hypothetical protein
MKSKILPSAYQEFPAEISRRNSCGVCAILVAWVCRGHAQAVPLRTVWLFACHSSDFSCRPVYNEQSLLHCWHVCIMSAIAPCVSWGPIHPRHMTRLHLSTYLSRYPRVPKPREGRGKRFLACAQHPRRTRGTESAILDAFPGILVVRRLPFYPGPSPHPERRLQTIYPTTSFPLERLINAKQCQLFSAQTVSQTSCHIQATL